MSIIELLATLKAKDIQLAVKDGQLSVQGNKQALSDPQLVARLREHKPALLAMLAAGEYSPSSAGQVAVPANGIIAGTTHITPAMLGLVTLDQASIDRVVAMVPGGAANVQDIYPLAPLQEGILYHHVSAAQGDPYVMQAQFAFASRERLAAFVQALQAVIERHDILRTAVLWDGLALPLQVVWRTAPLVVEEVTALAGEGDVLERLHAQFDARQYRLDVTQAPLMRLVHVWDEAGQRVVAMLLFHHMAIDHFGLEVVRHEMQAYLLGEAATLGNPVAFRNYVAQARLGVSEQEHEAFFRAMLADIDEPTLPFGLQDVQGDGNAITTHSVYLEQTLSLRLRAQARQLGVSAASLFHLGWAQVLAAVTGKPQVVFGTVLMGRLQGAEATDRALGIFINTLPLRVDLDGQGVRSAVKATHARLTTLMRHEHAPLALAQRCSAVAAPTPLFSTLLNYRHSSASATPKAHQAWDGIEGLHSEERTNYPLTLSVDDLGELFSLTLLVSTQIDASRVCAYMQCALENLAAALETAPDTPLQQLSILPAGEREQLLATFNATHVDFPQGQTIHQRIEAQAAEQPAAVAAVHQGQSLTYAALNRRANALAHQLTGLGVQPDDRVAVVAHRGLETLVGLLAILKAGAGYVPIDPAHPAERLNYLLNDSRPVVVLTQAALRARLPALAGPVLDLETCTGAERSENPQRTTLTPAHLAYVIYTSGSTGQPKGVMVEHRTLNNLVDWHCQAFDLCQGRHTSSLAGFGFDAMAWEIWPALCAGATLHLAPLQDGGEDIDALLGWWCAQPLDVSFLPTPIAEYAFSQQLEHPTLRTLLIGGDRLRQFSRNQRFEVINNYGPTEATVVATSGRVEAGQALHIGQPVSNAQVYVLDAQQQPVPIGVAGELYVGGAGVARGYLNQPQLTAERFLRDPFSRDPQARLYRTGDLVRWRADGTLDYLGRNDDQVKIRGVRIELGEIENRLNQMPGINEAVLLAREDEPGQVRLVAYFTEQAQVDAVGVGAMRGYLSTHLPAYMVPAAFVKLDALPLTANGKLDRRALPRPDESALFSREYEAPSGALETTLAQIWAEVLGVQQVGRRDHFFELGGHSLLAMRMVSQVRQRLGVELALSELFANAELAVVAQVLAQAGRGNVPAILPVPREGVLPLSFAQQRLWFLAQIDGASAAYNIPLGLHLRGRLDTAALQRALARIVARHETLRSRIVQHGSEEPQVLIEPLDGGLKLPVREIGEQPQALNALLQSEASKPFDLQDDALVRAQLLRLADHHHVLLLTLHHIVTDGWSMGVLTRELAALYQAFSQGQPDPLPALGLQYADYAVWQRRWLSGEVLQQQGDYWQHTLAGAPTVLMLPSDRPRPLEQQFAGSSVEVRLDQRLTAGLQALCQRHGVTLYMVMMSAWAMLMSRLAGQADVVIGSPVANRQRAEVEGLIGLFVNTLAIRVDTSGALTCEALLAQVKAVTLGAQAHQDLPFEQVVELVRPARSLAHSPLFQTVVSWQHNDHAALALGDLLLEGIGGVSRHAKFDLTLTLGETRSGIAGTLEYATALFDAATIQRYAGYFQQLLQAMVGNDQALLEQVELMQAEEREQILLGFNASEADFPQGLTIHQRIEAQAAARPDAVAAVYQGQTLNYAALNHQANALAHQLIALGVQPDDRVAIVARRGLETLVGLLAVLKAGAGYVPVDPAHPPERLNYLLGDSAPVVVLTQAALRARLPLLDVPVLELDQGGWVARHDNPQVAGLSTAHLAYVIYTSGSTGQPKGVMVEHRTLGNLVDWHCAAFELGAGSHTSSLAGFGFDAMAWEVWPALCAGATLHLAPVQADGEDIDALLAWWQAQPLAVSFLPTPIAEYAFSQQLQHPTLRTLLIGGDRLRQFARNQRFAVINNYGPTEASVVATSGRVEAGQALHIGKPVSNAQLYVLDEQQQPLPVGVAGELYVGGAGVARGYLNRPDLTAERFLRDPFSVDPQARLYRTGDLARWRADGTLDYLGRNDDQVKIRGVRIELGEIESRLNQLPGINEAVLLAREDQPGQIRLVAYYTEQAQAEPLAMAAMRASLAAHLPEYMVPVAFVKLPALPLTANGKVDRKALPKPDRAALFVREYQAPVGALEVALAQLWAELLQVEQVGRHDHFFELGGHSLLAMRMVSQVRERLGLELALAELFANAELAAVAQVLSRAERSCVPAIVAAPRDGALPLSFAQQRLWFLAQIDGASAAYNIPIGLRLRGQLHVEALQRALAAIVARHETLRSRFVTLDDAPQVQIVAIGEGLQLPVDDLGEHPHADQALMTALRREAAQPFDLQRDALIRGRLLRLADEHHVLLLTLHHIVADGWSMGVVTRELMALYQAFSQGKPDPLPALPLQYVDYAIWQRRWLSGEVLQRQGAFWQQALAGAPALLMLPSDRARPAEQDFTGSSITVHLDESLTAGLKTLCQHHGVTLYMVMMSAWAALLGRLSGQHEVVIGSPVANRQRAEIEGLIGLFVNTLAIRVDTSGQLNAAQLLARVKAITLDAQAHQDLPFEQVVELLRPVRSLAHSPLLQTLLSWESGHGTALVLGDLKLETLAEATRIAKFDLSLTLGEGPQGIHGDLVYASALFDAATIERYVGYFQQLLRAMVASDQTVLEQVELVQGEERRRLLYGFNATEAAFDREQTVHGLFEAQVSRTPQAIAVQAGEQQLTYAELNARANRLAHALRARGVQPDTRVALCVERGLELIIGVLGILKAGAAYVPLDPDYPQERLEFMLHDSAPLALLVHTATRARFADAEVECIDLDAPDAQDQPDSNPQVPGLSARNLAYVIYTSGSTGTPKGVMVEHHGVANLLHWSSRLCPPVAGGALLQKTPFSFDASVWELFWPLASGLRLVLAEPGGQRDPAYLAQLVQAQRISVIQFVPALLQQFIELDEVSQCSSLTDLFCGGGELGTALARSVRARLPKVRLHNVYGPTETTVDSTAWTLEAYQPVPETLPIGRPICNTRHYLLDDAMQPVPLGVSAQLYIGGAGVARGYLGLPELTAERFVDNPFVPGERLYCTGDLVRYRADGNLEFLGRNDFQIKLHGLRLEPGEIEARLAAHPAVRDAVVLVREERLVAYFTQHAPVEPDVLRQHVLATLPEYMVPAAFVALEHWPLSPNGKLDRAALPAPGADALIVREYVAPVGATEQLLAEIWAQLLKVERVGRHDNFFELGGHSLLAVSLIARMRKAGLSADVRVLFGQPTLAALAASVGSHAETEVPANRIPAQCTQITPALLPLIALEQDAIDRIVAGVPGGAANVQDIYPLAPLQAGILYHHLAVEQGDAYVLSAQFAFASHERLNAFTQALQAVIARNDILRTSMAWQGLEVPVQVVWREAPLNCEAFELSAEGDALAQLLGHFDTRKHRLALDQAPLMRLIHSWDAVNQRVVAVLLFHHLVMDHIALKVLCLELEAVLLGKAHLLAEPVPYRNYVAQTLAGLSEQAHEAYFREMLGDIDEPSVPFGQTQLQADGSLDEQRLWLPPELCRTLRSQARQLGISVASLMHLAWAQVLGQLSGQDVVVFGSVLLGRLNAGDGAERGLGMFINTLPLRVDLGEQSVQAAARATHQRLSGLLQHEHAPLALAQRCSGVGAGTPLFSTLLNFRHSAASESVDMQAGEAWHGMQLLQAHEASNFPVSLSVDDMGEGFILTAQVAADIDAGRICGYMQQALLTLSAALAAGPDAGLGQLSILPDAEREQLLARFNATEREYPRMLTVHQCFEAQVALRPQAVAARHGAQTLSYGELNERANRLAHQLIEWGVQPGDHVAILLERSLSLLVAQLAISKCAAAYVPLDIHAPAERQAYLLNDCAAVALLTDSGVSVVCTARRIDLDTLVLDHQPRHNPQRAQSAESVAYIMYTSGSTGAPKGVLVPHRAITRLVINNGYADFNAQDCIAFASNPAFDASTMDVWGALLNGGQVLVIEHATLLDPLGFGRALEAGGATVLFVTTALFNQYVQLIPQVLGGLRMLLCGGERADPAAFRRLLAEAAGVRLVHCYGPTETTTYATTHEVQALADGAEHVPIGRPIANTRVYVLDAQGQPAPWGAVGELYIGGQGVALGYLNRPQLTAERFLADPFDGRPGALMYRTGDLVRWLADGQLECLGRNDDQVKIRGFRIELGEVQSRLSQLPAINEAVVLARETEPGQLRLVAYYTEHAQAAPLTVSEIRTHLLARLPEYMVPTALVKLDALPLNGNGKVDRKALPMPDASALFTREYQAPSGAVESTLAQIWAELLQLERVGRQDHFFELGGHSLLAIRMVSQVRQRLGVDLALADLFADAELAAVAGVLSRAGRSSVPPILPAAHEGPLPLSFAQQRLWFLAQIEGANTAYNIPIGLRLRGQLHVEALQQALARIIARHETLRSRFIQYADAEPQVLIAPVDSGLLLHMEDLRDHPHAADVLLALIEGEASGPFDLLDDALVRGRLVRLADDHHVLLLTVHHIIADGWSMGVLTQELMALYHAFSLGKDDPLPALALQYGDYAIWQRRWLSGEVLQQQGEYWRQTLAAAPALLTLPTDRPRPAEQAFAGNSVEVRLDAALGVRLKTLCQRHGVTLYMVMMGAWAALMSRLAGQADVVIGSPVANRQRAEIEGLIGLFVNTLAIRLDTSGALSGASLLARVKAATVAAQAHQDLPFEQVVEMLRPARSLAHSPLFQTVLSWESSNGPGLALGELSLEPVAEPSHFAKFDLLLTLGEGPQGIGGNLVYATALFDEATIRRFVGYFEQLLEAMASDDQMQLEQVELVRGEERQRLLNTFNATTREYPGSSTVHQLFEGLVIEHPHAIAAVHGGHRLSYANLNTRANRLAHHLIECGVQPGEPVAILLERSLDLLVAQLAISKCAAAYVPLDIHAPAERQAFMLEDCAAVVLLTHSTVAARHPTRRLDLDTLALDNQPWHNPDRRQSAESVAYIMYTSGSTGAPKGVLVPHRAITRLIINNGFVDFNAQDCTAFAANPAFDASTLEVWGALLTGGQVLVIDHRTLLDPPAFANALEDGGATLLFLTTGLFNQYAQLIPAALGSLRVLMCGGERADPAAFRRLLAQGSGVRLVNGYGPTETTTFASTFEARNAAEVADFVPIGQPISNTSAYVLDAHGQLVPQGVVGELYIGGQGVALGYLNRPQLTAERFVRDPFSDKPGATLYRTGDLVRWLDGGCLEYLGRNDDQVKIRGFRIELGEIEAKMSSCEGVKDAVVLALDGRLVGYFTSTGVTPAELRARLQAVLPEYMVPSAYVQLAALPLTNNGKVDRKALPAPELEALAGSEYMAPASPEEKILAHLWAQVLEVERVGRHDNFFERGGHSLLAIRLVNLMQHVGLEVSLVELFQHPSVESLASLLSQRTAAPVRDETLLEVRGGQGTPLFLVHEFSGRDAYFPALGQHLLGDFPIYGLPGIPLGEPQLDTLEGMAARLVGIIRSVQPQGPYRLAGWSFGGVLAYEIALQLIGMDQAVAFLGLLDTFAPRLADQGKARWAGEDALKQQLLVYCSDQATALAALDFSQLLDQCRHQQWLPAAVASSEEREIRQYLTREVAHGHALAHYRVNPIGMPVHLFCAQERLSEQAQVQPLLGWDRELPAERLHCIEVPGSHQSMLQAPNVQALGQAITQALAAAVVELPAAYQPVLTIQTGHAGHAPIFCVPGAGDSVTGFLGLTEALGVEWPIHGLQPRGLDGQSVPHSQVEAAAQCYVEAITQMYPQGPVHLIGHSFGGWVAFEMAAVLRDAGREVASLTLIDSESPGGNTLLGKAYTTTAALQRLIEALQLSSGRSLGIEPQAFAEADDASQLRQLHAGMVRIGLLSARAAPQAMHGTVRTFASALRTVYQPREPYAGPVRLVLVEDPTLDTHGNQREQAAMLDGWRRYSSDLAVWYGPGNHFTLLKTPNVASLAAWWQDGLSVPLVEVQS